MSDLRHFGEPIELPTVENPTIGYQFSGKMTPEAIDMVKKLHVHSQWRCEEDDKNLIFISPCREWYRVYSKETSIMVTIPASKFLK